jgi:hypothetical protein
MKKQSEDPYAPIMAKMKAENQKAIQKLLKSAGAEREKAAAKRAAAEAELGETQKNVERLTAELAQKHRAKLEKELRRKVAADLALDLLYLKNPVSEVASLLDLPEGIVMTIAENVGMVRHEETESNIVSLMWLEEQSQGRGGNIIFHWGEITCRFWWEFGIGDTLAFIDVPKAEMWEAATGIPLERRDIALHFIGKKLAADRGLGSKKYRLEADAIVILRNDGA